MFGTWNIVIILLVSKNRIEVCIRGFYRRSLFISNKFDNENNNELQTKQKKKKINENCVEEKKSQKSKKQKEILKKNIKIEISSHEKGVANL